MDEINNEIIKALEGKVEIQAKMIKELKTRVNTSKEEELAEIQTVRLIDPKDIH